MLDKENVQQQEALGTVGVNLTYGAFYLHSEPEKLIASLLDGLSTSRIEVDMIKFSGPFFNHVDNRLMALQLVEKGLSNAALIGRHPAKSSSPPKSSIKGRSSSNAAVFVPSPSSTSTCSTAPRQEFLRDAEVKKGGNRRTHGNHHEQPPHHRLHRSPRDFLARADTINAVGKMVLISNYAEYYKLAAYLQRYTKSRIGLVLGIPNLKELFDEKYYELLEGGILESFGRLFKNDLKLYVYPFLDPAYPELTTVSNMDVPEHVTHLFKHLLQSGYVKQIENVHREYMGIFSRAILAKIRQHDHSWEKMVPPEVAARIKTGNFFRLRFLELFG